MRRPDLARQQSGCNSQKSSGDDIADEMPVPHHQQHRPDQLQYGKRQRAASIEPHENTGEGARENHMARGEAAARRAAEEMTGVPRSVQYGLRIRHPEKKLQNVVVDRIRTDRGQARKRGRLTQAWQTSPRDPDDNYSQRNRRFGAEKNRAGQALAQAFCIPQDSVDETSDGDIDVCERCRRCDDANQQRQEPHRSRKTWSCSFRRPAGLLGINGTSQQSNVSSHRSTVRRTKPPHPSGGTASRGAISFSGKDFPQNTLQFTARPRANLAADASIVVQQTVTPLLTPRT